MVGPYTPIGELLGHVHLSATNTFLALVIAEVYESAPYYVLGAQAAFAAVEPAIEEQAALLGDRPSRVARRVTLPLAAPGLAMALAVAWARAMGAFGAVVIIAYHPYGIPLQIWTTLQETGLSTALPFALVLRSSPCRCRWPPTSGARCSRPTSSFDRREFRLVRRLHRGRGERLALFGPSGAGKTTILEVVAGLLEPRAAP